MPLPALHRGRSSHLSDAEAAASHFLPPASSRDLQRGRAARHRALLHRNVRVEFVA